MRIYLDEEILQFIHRNTNDQLRIRFSIRVSDFYFLYLPIPSSFDVTVEGGLFDTYGFHTVSEIENPPFPVEVSLKEMIDTVISVTDFERHWDRAARLYFGGSATISIKTIESGFKLPLATIRMAVRLFSFGFPGQGKTLRAVTFSTQSSCGTSNSHPEFAWSHVDWRRNFSRSTLCCPHTDRLTS